jgi:hypothetical protein
MVPAMGFGPILISIAVRFPEDENLVSFSEFTGAMRPRAANFGGRLKKGCPFLSPG